MEAPDVRYIMYLMQLTLLMHLIHVMVEASIWGVRCNERFSTFQTGCTSFTWFKQMNHLDNGGGIKSMARYQWYYASLVAEAVVFQWSDWGNPGAQAAPPAVRGSLGNKWRAPALLRIVRHSISSCYGFASAANILAEIMTISTPLVTLQVLATLHNTIALNTATNNKVEDFMLPLRI